MTALNEASRRQHDAARPGVSTWLSANAGSGKTRVLTDRVARLLLDAVEPQHILCLTYTKAAASEMQNRLFQRLGAWAMLDDDDLRRALEELGLDRVPTTVDLQAARTLFARAIETPGGLKIQTIHSFCASLLRRFPLEAGVSPQFKEIEDRAADLLRNELLDRMADGGDAHLVTALAQQYSGDDILKLTRQIVSNKADFGIHTMDDALIAFGLPQGLSVDSLVQQTFVPGNLELIRTAAVALLQGSANDVKAGTALERVQTLDITALPHLFDAFLTKAGTRKKSFPTKATADRMSDTLPALAALVERVEDAQNALTGLNAAERTFHLHRFARQFRALYTQAKQDRAWLDFDDLIQKARDLLSDVHVAAWVLYRLDGGIDHILVDEAQDTSPTQWDVIRKLAEEFSSGDGARADVTRTIFVVGDKKQSIYSFQGADPREFDRMQAEFDTKLAESGQTLFDLTLDHSFRSSPAILELVDHVFKEDEAAGFAPDGSHIAFHNDMPGRVDLWPLVPKPEVITERDWFDPVDRRSPEHEQRTLAQAIARQIKDMVDSETPIPDGDGMRPVQPGDFLILVQRRSGVFSEIIRACKKCDLPIAGADRLKVGAEIAVKDLGALLSFLATPEDSLSLVTALRSPLFGWTEQDIFTLTHRRSTEFVWETLRGLDEQHPKTVSVLKDLRANIDYLRPYDLIERMLTRHGGRKRLLARLGNEAEDGIDALLSQALAYERGSVPSLTGFLTWMETDDLEIKRQIDSASNQIRVMTVHGAKGLEAPIVILPDCAKRTIRMTDDIVTINSTPMWRMPSGQQPDLMQEGLDTLRDAQLQESLRLLYVALTRAEKWLIVAAAGELSKDGKDWWQRVEAGMKTGGASQINTPTGSGLRMENGNWTLSANATTTEVGVKESPLAEVFDRPSPTPPRATQTISPSDLGGAKALPGDGLAEDEAKSYGTFVHLLLEELPLSSGDTVQTRLEQLRGGSDLSPELTDDACASVLRILNTPALAHIFAPDALAEVPFVSTLSDQPIHGTIDRLIVTPERVDIIDYKTNRVVPETPDACPEGLLRQMGAYRDAITQIYPDRDVHTWILWTQDATLMELPHDIVTAALERAQYLDVSGPAS